MWEGRFVCICEFLLVKRTDCCIWYAAFHLCLVMFPHCHKHDLTWYCTLYVCYICEKGFSFFQTCWSVNQQTILSLILLLSYLLKDMKVDMIHDSLKWHKSRKYWFTYSIVTLNEWCCWYLVLSYSLSQQLIVVSWYDSSLLNRIQLLLNHKCDNCIINHKYTDCTTCGGRFHNVATERALSKTNGSLLSFWLNCESITIISCVVQWYHFKLLRSCLFFSFFWRILLIRFCLCKSIILSIMCSSGPSRIGAVIV